jgi:hypothetical protein
MSQQFVRTRSEVVNSQKSRTLPLSSLQGIERDDLAIDPPVHPREFTEPPEFFPFSLPHEQHHGVSTRR